MCLHNRQVTVYPSLGRSSDATSSKVSCGLPRNLQASQVAGFAGGWLCRRLALQEAGFAGGWLCRRLALQEAGRRLALQEAGFAGGRICGCQNDTNLMHTMFFYYNLPIQSPYTSLPKSCCLKSLKVNILTIRFCKIRILFR